MTYVIIYTRDGGKSWRLWGASSEIRDDLLGEMARWQREQPLYQYAVKCLDTQLWRALWADIGTPP